MRVWHIVLGLVIASVCISVAAGSTLAARGGGGKPSPVAALTVTPTPAAAWSTFQAAGCGYTVGALTTVAIEKPEALALLNATPDANGCITFGSNTDGAGTYGLKVYQLIGKKNTLKGQASFLVQ